MATRRQSSTLWEIVKTVLYAVPIALVIRSFAFEPFSIPSSSMVPTLLIGDYLFVSKYSYGFSRYSLPFGLPLISGRILASEPERGDVVVFKLPADNATDYIKRIVGLPGDNIQIVNGILHINGTPVSRQPAGEYTDRSDGGGVRRMRRFIETLPNGRKHQIIEVSDSMPYDNTGVFTVPPGHYFALGDNRDNSRDSRFPGEVGFIPFVNLVGRAELIFLSIDGDIWRIWEWFGNLRLRRLFQTIE